MLHDVVVATLTRLDKVEYSWLLDTRSSKVILCRNVLYHLEAVVERFLGRRNQHAASGRLLTEKG